MKLLKVSKTNNSVLKALEHEVKQDNEGFESLCSCRGRLLRKPKDDDAGEIEPLIPARRVLDGCNPCCSWFDELVVDHAALVPSSAFFGCFDFGWRGRRSGISRWVVDPVLKIVDLRRPF